ncbi:hypothetical protein [Fluviicola sp.]|uniref:hypothetical protein n=1 Tax=Fluviicola sp. TaxID=1917219 RepID=UPI003D2C3C20
MKTYIPDPVETSNQYNVLVKYLESKDSPKAKRLLEKLRTFKTVDEYYDFTEYLLFDLFIEIS